MYTQAMIRTQIYLPEEMHIKLNRLAAVRNEPMAHVVRSFVEEGLQREQPTLQGNASILLEIAQNAQAQGWRGPGDVSERHNEYFQEEWNEQEQARQSR
jgi:hypothetical protein